MCWQWHTDLPTNLCADVYWLCMLSSVHFVSCIVKDLHPSPENCDMDVAWETGSWSMPSSLICCQWSYADEYKIMMHNMQCMCCDCMCHHVFKSCTAQKLHMQHISCAEHACCVLAGHICAGRMNIHCTHKGLGFRVAHWVCMCLLHTLLLYCYVLLCAAVCWWGGLTSQACAAGVAFKGSTLKR